MLSPDAAFDQADANNDGVLTPDEFRNFAVRNSMVGNNALYGSSNFTVGSELNNLAGGATGYGSSSYESSSFRSSIGNIGGESANVNAVYNNAGAAGVASTDAASASYSSTSRTSTVQQYETDAQGNYKDSNPQFVRRPAQGGPLTYTQNIKVRFLQPPAVPPPGVSALWTHSCFFFIVFKLFLLATDH